MSTATEPPGGDRHGLLGTHETEFGAHDVTACRQQCGGFAGPGGQHERAVGIRDGDQGIRQHLAGLAGRHADTRHACVQHHRDGRRSVVADFCRLLGREGTVAHLDHVSPGRHRNRGVGGARTEDRHIGPGFRCHGPMQRDAERLGIGGRQRTQVQSRRAAGRQRRRRYDGCRWRRCRAGFDSAHLGGREQQRLFDVGGDLLGILRIEVAAARRLRQAHHLGHVFRLHVETDHVRRDARRLQFGGRRAQVGLAIVRVVMDQQQRARARVPRERLGGFAQGQRERSSSARIELLERAPSNWGRRAALAAARPPRPSNRRAGVRTRRDRPAPAAPSCRARGAAPRVPARAWSAAPPRSAPTWSPTRPR